MVLRDILRTTKHLYDYDTKTNYHKVWISTYANDDDNLNHLLNEHAVKKISYFFSSRLNIKIQNFQVSTFIS